MHIESLAFRTDLALLALGGSEIEDAGSHVVVRTPGNPDYYWGNFLLFPSAPTRAEVSAWDALFAQTFPAARHRAYGVATAHGTAEDLSALAEAGFAVDASSVMTASSVHEPPRPNREATYRPLASDDDWEQQVELTLSGGDGAGPSAAERAFVVAKTASERRAVDSGAGTWWGAFVGDRLLSSMGLFRADDGLFRFQEVKTDPEGRGRGLAGTLVHDLSRHAFDDLGATTLVMVADPDYLAIRVYRSVGFADTETWLGADRKPA